MGAISSRYQKTIDNQPKKDDKPITKPTPRVISKRTPSEISKQTPGHIDNKASNYIIRRGQHKHVPHIKPSTTIRRADLPHYLDEILTELDEGKVVDRSSTEKLYKQLYDGIFLKGNKKKYWVDEKTRANCFMLYAKDLSITWGEDERYWKWFDIEESDVTISVAQLESVCWLEVCGRFDSAALSPETLYEVLFEVMIKEQESYGLDSPITLRFVLPNKYRNDVEVNLNEKEKEKWLQLSVGEFTSSEWAKKNEEIEIFMYEIKKLNWKRGLVVKGIIIRPKH